VGLILRLQAWTDIAKRCEKIQREIQQGLGLGLLSFDACTMALVGCCKEIDLSFEHYWRGLYKGWLVGSLAVEI